MVIFKSAYINTWMHVIQTNLFTLIYNILYVQINDRKTMLLTKSKKFLLR